jgi:hypothetical protein
MADEQKKTIIVNNKGRRTWTVKNSDGVMVRLEPLESVEMDELDALRLIQSYPRDVTQAGPATMSSANLERAEQSLRDRAANLDKREARIKEKEKELGLSEEIAPVTETENQPAPVKKTGRPKANP